MSALALACGLAAALVLAACSSAPATGPGGSPIPAGLQRFYDQKLHWVPCPPVVAEASGVAANAAEAQKAVAGFQCTTLTVPLDYAHPDGATIKLAMNRLPATDKSDRIGPLLTNPGGPGGTLLGQVYAQMFPHNVGRMVLDSIDNPTGAGDPTAQAVSFETTFNVLIESCIERGDCPMGSSKNEVLARFDSLLSSLETAPVTLGNGRPPLTASGVIGFVQEDLYSEQKWPAIEDTLGLLFREVPASANGASRSAPAKASIIAQAVAGSGNDEMSGSFQAIDCLTVPADQRTVAAAVRAGQEAQTVAPHFGPTVAEQWLECAKWPVPSPPAAGRAISAAGTPTILLVNNSYDPATPLSWATAVHGQLANSVLVTNTAGGHGFYPMGACTHNVVDTFLISGSKPAPGTACHDKNPVLAPSPISR